MVFCAECLNYISFYFTGRDSIRITVENVQISEQCEDNPHFANCKLIVRAQYCTNKYYAKFCCRSCTLAGQLRGGRSRGWALENFFYKHEYLLLPPLHITLMTTAINMDISKSLTTWYMLTESEFQKDYGISNWHFS